MIMKFLLAAVAAFALPTIAVAQVGPPHERYIVVLNERAGPPDAVAERLEALTGGRIGFVYDTVLNGFSIAMPAAALARLRNDPNVAYVEKDIPVTAFAQSIPTGIDRIFADFGSLDIDGADDKRIDVDVAVLDTGIDYQHPDLHVVGGANCLQSTGGPWWRRTYYCDSAVSSDDDHYHGTHVAGTIGALDNGIGVVGVAPGARLWAIKVLSATGSGSLSGIIAGVDWVTAQGGIEVINMSLGGAGTSAAMNTSVANAVAAGVTVVVAAGNDDQNASGFTPANAPDAITVSALADFDRIPGGLGFPTCRTDQDDTLADFSNWGAVNIAAPGVCILSTYPIEQGGYGTISGTSMASPHVAGAAALLASNGDTPAMIRSTLLSTGNLNWTDDSGDGVKERLLDISSTEFIPTLVNTGGPANNPPTANISVSCVNLTCNFDGSGSSDPDGDALSYAWDFDNNGSTDSTAVAPTHNYPAAGSYTAKLTVSDPGGLNNSATENLTVSNGGGVCSGLANGLHLSGSSTSQGPTWTAILDAVYCSGGAPANFVGGTTVPWSPNLGGGGCLVSGTGVCQATQSGIRKRDGSVQATMGGKSITILKP